MLIEIHAIQNHSPANLNRDDLGAPKTGYFGGLPSKGGIGFPACAYAA